MSPAVSPESSRRRRPRGWPGGWPGAGGPRRRGAPRPAGGSGLVAAVGLVGLLALGGCAGTASPRGAPAPGISALPPTSARPAASVRPPSPRRSTARPRPSPPPPVDGPCPYADTDTMSGIVGQQLGRTTVTRTTPHPGCGYYRGDGEQAVAIAVAVLGTPVEAQTRAIERGGPTANPVDDVADGGVVAITDTGAILAVSKGRALIVVRINQRSSLEAVEVARLVAARI